MNVTPNRGGGGGRWCALLLGLGAAALLAPDPIARAQNAPAVGTPDPSPSSAIPGSLPHARQGFVTRRVPSSYRPDGEAPVPPGGIFELVEYPSPVGNLSAYITPDPGDGRRRPALIWAHGGFGGIGSWLWEEPDYLEAFRDAGFVVFCPSWRGENDNPGTFELFYGEVDDALAAIDHVRSLPHVDPDRVYMAGHSTGGTITMLAASSTDKLRAAFSFGGAPDIGRVLGDGAGYGNTPFPHDDERESRLRSAIHFVAALRTPTLYVEGSDSFYVDDAREMMRRAQAHKAPFRAYIIPGGDHFNIVQPLSALLAERLTMDTRDDSIIPFTEAEALQAFERHVQALIDGERTADRDEWRNLLTGAVDQLQIGRALRLGAAATRRFPEDAQIAYFHGAALAFMHHRESARVALERAHALAPHDIDILIELVDLSWNSNQLDKVRSYLDKALTIAPDHEGLLDLRADLERQQRVRAGQALVPDVGTAGAVAHEFLAEMRDSPISAIKRHVSRDLIRDSVDGMAQALGDERRDTENPDLEGFYRGVSAGIEERGDELGIVTYYGFEVVSEESEAEGGGDPGTIVVTAQIITESVWTRRKVEQIDQARNNPSLARLQDEGVMAIASGLDPADRRAWYRRLLDQPPTPYTIHLQMKMQRDPKDRWLIRDVNVNGRLWLSQMGSVIGPVLASGLMKKPRPRRSKAEALGRIVGRLLFPVIGVVLLIVWIRRTRARYPTHATRGRSRRGP